MTHVHRSIRQIALCAILLFWGHMPLAGAAASAPDPGWPRDIQAGTNQIVIYQPQVEKWNGNQLEQRAAVSVQKSSASTPEFGVVWMTARTEVDKSTGQVALEDLKITRTHFPSESDDGAAIAAQLREKAPEVLRPVALDRLKASLAITLAESKRQAPDLKNNAPKLYYSSSPSLLVLIDGAPVLRDSGTPGLLRIVNTHALILLDQSNGTYYLYLAHHWMSAPAESGPWSLDKNPPKSTLAMLEKAKQTAIAQKEADPLDEPSVIESLNQGTVPKIFVSTTPAELIQTNGTPQFQPVADTQLLYVKNATGDLFLDTADQNYYFLTSGRWYHSSSLEGSWTYTPQRELPADFAKIPENHPKGAVLASVAGTEQAQEAAISNDIPQTATVDREQAHEDVSYDGAPEFKPIEGTPLQYAFNSANPVIRVDEHSYYSVQNGVWFAATSPSGPWAVTDRVPSVIYTIPPSSPIYYVTYVHVYGSTPRYVYVGYQPGYLGSYVTSDGTVVFGTGYVYPSWVGSVWIGPPVTYGFGVAWGPGFGWGFHLGFYGGFYGGPCYHPWWGPWGWAWAHGVSYSAFNTGRVSVNQVNFNQTNIYRGWGGNVVHNTVAVHGPFVANHAARTAGGPGFGRTAGGSISRPNNVYADRQGHVYQHDNRTGWHQMDRPANTARAQPQNTRQSAGRFASQGELDRERSARAIGESHTNYASRGYGGTGGKKPVPVARGGGGHGRGGH